MRLLTLNEHSDELCSMVVALDVDGMAVSFGCGFIRLTDTEFRIMRLLVEAKGKAVPKQLILREVWGDYATVDNLNHRIRSLREKVGHERIVNVYGYGYVLRI